MSKGVAKAVEALGTVLTALDGLDSADQLWVMESVGSRLGVKAPVRTSELDQAGDTAPVARGEGAGITAKAFLKQKNPQTDVQRVTCLAYYLNHHKGAKTFNAKELAALNIEAAGTRIGNLSQAVANATKQNQYFAPAGGGKKQITSFGEDMVDALPDQEKVKAADKNRPRKRKGSRKKGKD